MAQGKTDRVRGLVMFVVAWLIGLYVYEVVEEAFHGPIGVVAAVVTMGVNLYARKRAVACVEATLTFKFWLYLPIILFLVVPVAVKVIVFVTSKDDRTWWDHVGALLPFILKLGVPVLALLWVYWSLGRGGEPADEGERPAVEASELS